MSLYESRPSTFVKIEGGSTGGDGIIKSATAPEDTSKMWLDTSVEPYTLKHFDGEVWVATNDESEKIQEAIAISQTEYASSLEQTKQSIKTTIKEEVYTKIETDEMVNSLSSSITQTKDDITFQFNKSIQDLSDETNEKFEEQSKYINFSSDGIQLGDRDSSKKLEISDEKIAYSNNGEDVSWWDESTFYNTNLEVTNSLRIGKFAFIPRENGSLDFKKVGD